jgi:hypothetical protein
MEVPISVVDDDVTIILRGWSRRPRGLATMIAGDGIVFHREMIVRRRVVDVAVVRVDHRGGILVRRMIPCCVRLIIASCM